MLLFPFVKMKELGARYTAMQTENELALSEEEDAKSKFCSLSEVNPNPALLCHEDKLQISRG